MTPLCLLYQRDRWLAFDRRQRVELDDYPRLDRPAIVVCDLDDALSGVMALKGSSAHAAASIEKRLRGDGLLDGESKIIIHHAARAGDGYQALYTAVPAGHWQRLMAWAQGQRDHCLLMPHVGLLWQRLRPGRAAVLRLDRQFVFVARLPERPIHASAIAFSGSAADLALAASALGERVGDQLAQLPAPLEVEWLCADTRADAGAMRDEQILAATFAADSGQSVRLAPHAETRDGGNGIHRSALPHLLSKVPALAALNPAPGKIAYIAERSLPWLSVASVLLAAGLTIVAMTWSQARHAAESDATALREQALALEQDLPALIEAGRMPAAVQPTLDFLAQAHAVQTGVEPERVLTAVRQAAAGEVRILRLRAEGEREPRPVTVEGRVAGEYEAQRLARFVERLRQAGYEPRAVDAATAASGQPTGYFAYRLLPAAAAQGGAP